MAKILVVDDDVLNTELIQVYLASEGHEVTTAHSLAHAREVIAAQNGAPQGTVTQSKSTSCSTTSFDVMLLDMRLPDGSGLELLGFAKHHHVHTIIALSGNEQSTSSPEIDRWMIKPIDIEILAATIRSISAPSTTTSSTKR